MTFSWSEFNDHRRSVRSRWPTIWRLPLIPRSMRYAARRIPAGATVLDIGASDGRFGKKLPPGTSYRILDTDPKVPADYRSLDEVETASIDAVVSFETIEHLSLPEAIEFCRGVTRVLVPGGRLFLSTPNIHHPWSYLRSATHKTPFCYDELGGLLENDGLVMEAFFRCHHDAVLKGALRFLARPLYRLVGLDYAKSLLAVARRPGESTSPEI